MVLLVNFRQAMKGIVIFLVLAAMYILYQKIGLNMTFMLVLSLLSLRFFPKLFLPMVALSAAVYFTGGFSFIADFLEAAYVVLLAVAILFFPFVPLHLYQRFREWRQRKN